MIGIEEARSRFASLVREAREGAEIVISIYGKPAAKLVPCEPPVVMGASLDDAAQALRDATARLKSIEPLVQKLTKEKSTR